MGLKIPPTVAKTETISPPIRNRASASVNVFHRFDYDCFFGIPAPDFSLIRRCMPPLNKRCAVGGPFLCGWRRNLTHPNFPQLALSSYL
jgi:hypothetical protein